MMRIVAALRVEELVKKQPISQLTKQLGCNLLREPLHKFCNLGLID
jgi:hypothetical protein